MLYCIFYLYNTWSSNFLFITTTSINIIACTFHQINSHSSFFFVSWLASIVVWSFQFVIGSFCNVTLLRELFPRGKLCARNNNNTHTHTKQPHTTKFCSCWFLDNYFLMLLFLHVSALFICLNNLLSTCFSIKSQLHQNRIFTNFKPLLALASVAIFVWSKPSSRK